MLFPQFHIDEVKKQNQRDLARFDLAFDIPDAFLPGFPPAIFLTTRPDLGDVSQGKLLTTDNYYELMQPVLNPKQLEGLRLLLAPTPQQQFNQTEDRRSARPSLGVTCFDCHANGHTNGATHLAGDARPQEFRHRIETPTLRGMNIQRLFGSQRALKSVEDFTEFEQRAAYFDGDPVLATKKGVNVLERGSQVHFMAEFQALLDFPPAPKLGVDGKLDPAKATDQEKKGQQLFFGKAQCGSCHPAPYYTDNLMHNLKTERFYAPRTVAGHAMVHDVRRRSRRQGRRRHPRPLRRGDDLAETRASDQGDRGIVSKWGEAETIAPAAIGIPRIRQIASITDKLQAMRRGIGTMPPLAALKSALS